MERRDFVRNACLLCASAPVYLSGCGSPLPGPDTTIFRGWAYEPDWVLHNLRRFEQQNPDCKVDYEAVAGSYHDKMVAMFVARTPIDVCYVRDDHFAEWVMANWLQPIDGLPRVEQYRADLYPYNLDAMTFEGKFYGLPYYTDFTIWIYNERMLHNAGFEKSARTLDGITEQCIRIKERAIRDHGGLPLKYPLTFAFSQSPLGFNDFWAFMYGSEVDLFDDDLNPRFPDDDGRRAERVLQWFVDGLHQHQIIDPSSIATSGEQTRDNFANGRAAFVAISKYDLQRVNNPRKSALAAGAERERRSKPAKMASFPGLEEGHQGTLAWSRMYCITKLCRDVERAWKLMEFVGGRDAEGQYWTAKKFYLDWGLGFAQKSLIDDKDLIATTERWGDFDLIRAQNRTIKAREIIKAPWFAKFDAYYQGEIQSCLLGERSPRDTLGRIAKLAQKLKREWSA